MLTTTWQYGWKWASILISFGAFAALTTSILGNLLSQPRIFFSMARDGLLFSWFGKIHPKYA
jgi:basic amino acid/polyamine antiporter, APA family